MNMDQVKIEKAAKHDAGKPRIDLVAPEFVMALGAHCGVGAAKYGDRNWERGMSWSRLYAAAQRHMLAWQAGEDIDPDTGTHHVVSAGWSMMALYHYAVFGVGTDDRPRPAGRVEADAHDAVSAALEHARPEPSTGGSFGTLLSATMKEKRDASRVGSPPWIQPEPSADFAAYAAARERYRATAAIDEDARAAASPERMLDNLWGASPAERLAALGMAPVSEAEPGKNDDAAAS